MLDSEAEGGRLEVRSDYYKKLLLDLDRFENAVPLSPVQCFFVKTKQVDEKTSTSGCEPHSRLRLEGGLVKFPEEVYSDVCHPFRWSGPHCGK